MRIAINLPRCSILGEIDDRGKTWSPIKQLKTRVRLTSTPGAVSSSTDIRSKLKNAQKILYYLRTIKLGKIRYTYILASVHKRSTPTNSQTTDRPTTDNKS